MSAQLLNVRALVTRLKSAGTFEKGRVAEHALDALMIWCEQIEYQLQELRNGKAKETNDATAPR